MDALKNFCKLLIGHFESSEKDESKKEPEFVYTPSEEEMRALENDKWDMLNTYRFMMAQQGLGLG
jgi:hypothetical protein